tara:strand:- start:226 stop:534 length:309 start_codon:yes stop_codon:yes gene_type:complete
MKKYLFGLTAMLVGAGLMFVFTHTEVSAESEEEIDFICEDQILGKQREKPSSIKRYGKFRKVGKILECKKGKTTCYYFNSWSGNDGNAGQGGLSCINTGMFN